MVFIKYEEEEWNVSASNLAKNTFNPIRNILETMNIQPHPDRPMISLSIGDPTIFGNLNPSSNAITAITEALQSGKYNGYAPSSGYVESRQAIAEHVSCGGNDIKAEDVIIVSGCSCALDMSISALANPGDNILVPRPGFPLYKTLANGLGINTKEYNLLPLKGWECDLEHMEAMIDENTKAILVNNPSNPCGSVFSQDHLLQILALADKYKVPIIADEIYEHFVFSGAGKKYVPMASLTTTVPVLSCGGLTKRYLVPGWRLGWITIHDRQDLFLNGGVRKGLNSLSQRIIGANTIVQGALPNILKQTPEAFFKETLDVIEENAKYAFERFENVPGLYPVMPDGAMYMMVGLDRKAFPEFANCLKIVEGMVREQSVFCLPGKCFGINDFFRVVLTVPKENLETACDRIEQFCKDHLPIVNKKRVIPKLRHQDTMAMDVMEITPDTPSPSSTDEEDDFKEFESGSIETGSYTTSNFVQRPAKGVPRVRRQTEMRLTSMSAK